MVTKHEVFADWLKTSRLCLRHHVPSGHISDVNIRNDSLSLHATETGIRSNLMGHLIRMQSLYNEM